MCTTPLTIRIKTTNTSVAVPCGRCPECKKRRASGWSFRLMQQELVSDSSMFITLTYAPDHIRRTKNNFATLDKSDCQKFFKRLRKAMPKESKPIKYFLVGEYGTKSYRPHYHAIVFNAQRELIEGAWMDPESGTSLGHVHIGDVSGASVGYTMKYISKGGKIPLHKNDDRVPEFSLMSKGIGENYLTDAMIKWHKADPTNRVYCVTDGKKNFLCLGITRIEYTTMAKDFELPLSGRVVPTREMMNYFEQILKSQ